ncbi:MAG: zf-HC2 domain-containing protein [Anaerolineaceae bacterium]|nr:zf-HC2 domain-containing protein [Anaerolineaceae bacterium]
MKNHTHCQQLLHSLSDYVDGNLDECLCFDLEQHLQTCPDCQIVVNTMRKTIELYHTCGQLDTMPEDVRARLYMKLDLEDYLQR